MKAPEAAVPRLDYVEPSPGKISVLDLSSPVNSKVEAPQPVKEENQSQQQGNAELKKRSTTSLILRLLLVLILLGASVFAIVYFVVLKKEKESPNLVFVVKTRDSGFLNEDSHRNSFIDYVASVAEHPRDKFAYLNSSIVSSFNLRVMNNDTMDPLGEGPNLLAEFFVSSTETQSSESVVNKLIKRHQEESLKFDVILVGTSSLSLFGTFQVRTEPPSTTQAPIVEVYRISAGSSQSIVESDLTWSSDIHYYGGKTINTISAGSTVFTSERYWTSDDTNLDFWGYKLPVSDFVVEGEQNVFHLEVHFSENWFKKARVRVFGVEVNGKPLSPNELDIFSLAGGKEIPIVLKRTLIFADGDLTGGSIDLRFLPSIENPMIQGIVLQYARSAPRPIITSSVDSLNFGILYASFEERNGTISLRNPSPWDMIVKSLEIQDGNGDTADLPFTIVSPTTSPIVISKESSLNIIINYSPTQEMEHIGKLLIHFSTFSPNNEVIVYGEQYENPWFIIPLIGKAKKLPAPILDLSQPIVNFGIVEHSTKSEPVTKVLSILNRGDAPLVISKVELVGGGEGIFVASIPSLPITLIPTESTSFEVSLVSEKGYGSHAAQLLIHSNDMQKVHSFELIAKVLPIIDGGSPLLSVEPSIVVIPATSPGDMSPYALKIKNTGPQDAKISIIDFSKVIEGSVDAIVIKNSTSRMKSGAFHEVAQTIPSSSSFSLFIEFSPPYEGVHKVCGTLYGNFLAVDFCMEGSGVSFGGAHVLHPVITVPSVLVDYDGDKKEKAHISGMLSHTHETGFAIAKYVWSIDFTTIDSNEIEFDVMFSIGSHYITLLIVDTGGKTLSTYVTVDVVPPTRVPGGVLRYYPSNDVSQVFKAISHPMDLPDESIGYIELPGELKLIKGGSGLLGSSNYNQNVVIKFSSSLDTNFFLESTLISISFSSNVLGCKSFLNGALIPAYGAAVSPGKVYQLDVLCAIQEADGTLIELLLDGKEIETSVLYRDDSSIPPFINSLSKSIGFPEGGDQITLFGVGFRKPVSVYFGNSPANIMSTSFSEISVKIPAGSAGSKVPIIVNSDGLNSFSKEFSYSMAALPAVVFYSKQVYTLEDPVQAEWGPDGKLYVGTLKGEIHQITFDEDYNVVTSKIITTLVGQEYNQIIGLTFSPYEDYATPHLYVSHSKIYYLDGLLKDDVFFPYIGKVSLLVGPDFSVAKDVVTGLPTSNHDHSNTALAFTDEGHLIIGSGGNTNAGIPSKLLGYVDESPLAGGIIRAKIYSKNFNGKVQYVRKDTGVIDNDQWTGHLVKVAPSVVGVDMYAHGLRNPFDFIVASNGKMWATDNGPNKNYGLQSTGPNSIGGHADDFDELCDVEEDHYYGHPNRNRGEEDPRQNIFYDTSYPSIPGKFTQCIPLGFSSAVGITEYRGMNFQGQLQGDLFFQKWKAETYRYSMAQKSKIHVSSLKFNGLDVVYSPGGFLMGIQYIQNQVIGKVIFGAPIDSSLGDQPYLFDIFPYRASPLVNTQFTISGHNLGPVSSVSFPGCKVTSFDSLSSKRIIGKVCSPTTEVVYGKLLSIQVTLLDGSILSIPNAFKWISKTD